MKKSVIFGNLADAIMIASALLAVVFGVVFMIGFTSHLTTVLEIGMLGIAGCFVLLFFGFFVDELAN